MFSFMKQHCWGKFGSWSFYFTRFLSKLVIMGKSDCFTFDRFFSTLSYRLYQTLRGLDLWVIHELGEFLFFVILNCSSNSRGICDATQKLALLIQKPTVKSKLIFFVLYSFFRWVETRWSWQIISRGTVQMTDWTTCPKIHFTTFDSCVMWSSLSLVLLETFWSVW